MNRSVMVCCGVISILLVLTAALTVLAGPSSTPKALNTRQVEGLVRGRVATQRIIELVEKHGINFTATAEFLSVLQKDGARQPLLDLLQKMHPRSLVADRALPNAKGLHAQAQLLLRHRLWSQAEGDLRELVRLNPADAKAHFDLGLVLSKEGKLNESIDQYRQTILLSPDSASPRLNLANDLMKENRVKGAIDQYHQAVTLSPDDARAYSALGIALYRSGDNPAAETALTTALRLDPQSAKAHLALGLALARQGDEEGAIHEYQRAVKINPRSAMAHADLAMALLKKGDPQDALRELRAAMTLKPENNHFRVTYENVLNHPTP